MNINEIQRYHPGPACPCDDCTVEYVKDWEDGEPIYFPED